MKNILLGSITLALFALIITTCEMSCQKIDAQANRPASPTAVGIVLYSKFEISTIIPLWYSNTDSLGNTIITSQRNDTLYKPGYYTCNLDGSNQQQIPIQLPAGLEPVGEAKIAANGSSIVFNAQPIRISNGNGTGYSYAVIAGTGIYTCGIDGSGLKLILENKSSTRLIEQVYLNDAD